LKDQSEQGAIWIPACLLEIVPNQPVTMPLNPGHTTLMIDNALRLPAPNVKYISTEGLNVCGFGTPTGQKYLVSILVCRTRLSALNVPETNGL
jgi:hypothetical protein